MSMTKEAAAQHLYDNVQVPAFVNRLQTQWGITPQNTAELQTMLKMAGQLASLNEVEKQKQQAAGNSFLQKAANILDSQTRQALPQAYDPLPQLIQQTAKAAAANPEFVEACRALQA